MRALRNTTDNAKGKVVRLRLTAGVLRPLSMLLAAVLFAGLFGMVGCTSKDAKSEESASELAGAQASYDTGEFAQAEKSLRALLKESPDDLDVLRTLALALAAQGKNDEAIQTYVQIVEKDPKDHASLYRLALLERLSGAPKDAADHLRAALELKSKDPSYTDELARTLMSLGDYQQAATVWGSLLKDDELPAENRKTMLVLQGQAYQAAKDYTRAERAYSAALKIDPDDAALRDRVEAFQ